MSKTYVYHKTKKPLIVNSEDAEAYYKDGWADTPAAFFDMKKNGLNPDDPAMVQAVGETLAATKDTINGALNVDEMTKKELISYAKGSWGVELSPRDNHPVLLAKVRALITPEVPACVSREGADESSECYDCKLTGDELKTCEAYEPTEK